MSGDLIHFLWGAIAMACAVAGLFFFRFWRTTKDRLFVFFALAFWTLGLSWCSLALAHPSTETEHYQYAVRLIGFVLLIIGIVAKNRDRPAR
jgi:hypothetical protein